MRCGVPRVGENVPRVGGWFHVYVGSSRFRLNVPWKVPIGGSTDKCVIPWRVGWVHVEVRCSTRRLEVG